MKSHTHAPRAVSQRASVHRLQQLMMAVMAFTLAACGGGGGSTSTASAAASTATASAPASASASAGSTSSATPGSPAASPSTTATSSSTSAQTSASTASAAGAVFQVSATGGDLQSWPSVARTADGGSVVAWTSSTQGMCTRRLGADGTAQGAPTCVATTVNGGDRPAIAALGDGSWVVAWSAALGNNAWAVRAQRFAAGGGAIGALQAVPTAGGLVPENVTATGLAGGGYVLGWTALDPGAETTTIHAQRFANDGTAASAEQQVNTTPPVQFGGATMPVAMALPGGGYAFAWNQQGAVLTRRFAANDTGIGADVMVAGDAGFVFQHVGAAALPGGGSVIAWNANGAIAFRRYAADGSPVGPESVVEQLPAPDASVVCYTPQPAPCQVSEAQPDVAALDDGGFVIAYAYQGLPGTDDAGVIHARRYAAGGAPAGAAARVSEAATTAQMTASTPAVAGTANGGFVVAWAGQRGATAIEARQFTGQGLAGQ